jgi:hypothetical protein
MASALRAQILAAQDIRTERVTVAAWGVEVEVRGLTGAQRAAALERAMVTVEKGGVESLQRDDTKLSALLIIEATYDPATGERVFEDADIDPVMGKSAGALDQVAAVAMRLNGMTVEEHKAIEKNSVATVTGTGASG